MANKCLECGKDSNDYLWCKNCFKKLKNNKEIIQCDKCDEWHYVYELCSCEKDKEKNKLKKENNSYKLIEQLILNNENIKSEIIEDYTYLNEIEKDYRLKHNRKYYCTDGHYVRSKAEREIDEYLVSSEILHYYEPQYIALNNQIYYPDFYIPSLKLYIEYFGVNKEEYLERCKEKRHEYEKDNNVKFAYLYPEHELNLRDYLSQIIIKRKRELNR